MRRQDLVRQHIRVNGAKERNLAALSSLVTRAALAQAVGQTFDGKRDLYAHCGYVKTISVEDFWMRYRRQDVAKRVVNAFPDATWSVKPDVYDTDEGDASAFEKAWEKLCKETKALYYLHRLDKLCGVASYGGLVIGLDDGKSLSEEPGKAKKITYLQPYSQRHLLIDEYETEKNSERYGLPSRYNLLYDPMADESSASEATRMATGKTDVLGATGTVKVHWKRVLHVAEGCLSSDVFGVPRMESVWNRLVDLEKLAGGSAEMYWQGAFPGMAMMMEADAQIGTTDQEAMEDEIEEYIHGLRRIMRLKGVKPQSLSQQIANADSFTTIHFQLISCATGIPMRILTGSERGELASSQDTENWMTRVNERRVNFATPGILIPFAERCVELGVLPEAQGEDNEVKVDWPPTDRQNDAERAATNKVKIDLCAAYINGGVEALIPPEQFMERFLELEPEEAEQMLEEAEEYVADQQEEAAVAAKEAGVQLGPDGQPIQAGGAAGGKQTVGGTSSAGAAGAGKAAGAPTPPPAQRSTSKPQPPPADPKGK